MAWSHPWRLGQFFVLSLKATRSQKTNASMHPKLASFEDDENDDDDEDHDDDEDDDVEDDDVEDDKDDDDEDHDDDDDNNDDEDDDADHWSHSDGGLAAKQIGSPAHILGPFMSRLS